MRAGAAQRRFTADEFHQMGRAGILCEDDRVELIEGQVVEMAAIGSRHAACVARLTRLVAQEEAILWVQNPVRLDQYTELVPDVALLRHREDFYADLHPGPGDLLVVMEVADPTLAHDRRVKVPLYGRAGVPEVWLVDLVGRRIEVFWHPDQEGAYRERIEIGPTESAASQTVPGLVLVAVEVLGQPPPSS